jgi:hypothetical protein
VGRAIDHMLGISVCGRVDNLAVLSKIRIAYFLPIIIEVEVGGVVVFFVGVVAHLAQCVLEFIVGVSDLRLAGTLVGVVMLLLLRVN